MIAALAAKHLISPEKLRSELTAAAAQAGTAKAELRPAIVKILKTALEQSHTLAEQQLVANGEGTRCAESLSLGEDEIIRSLFDLASNHLFPAQGTEEKISVVAVGGYGRGTLAPGSDIDLLFVLPARQTERVQNIVEFLLYCLWDTRQKVGHATRSIDECIRLAKSDNTILTAILEARYICGNEALFERLVTEFRREIVSKGAKDFIADKLGERDLRHLKVGESRYIVEPDVKDGKGGLRDLNTLFWIAKYIYATNSTDELAEKGAFSHEELANFKKCERFLWAVRCHLHFLSKRGNDRLSFDRQSDIAERLGYKAHGGLKHVERFMKHYFLVAKDVGDLTRILCASLEAQQVKDAPGLGRVLGRLISKTSGTLRDAPDFRVESGRVVPSTPDIFVKNPVNIIRLFAVAGRHGAEIHPDARKQMRFSSSCLPPAKRPTSCCA